MGSCHNKGRGQRPWRYAFGAFGGLLIMAAIGFMASKGMASHVVTESEDVKQTKHNMTENPDVKVTGTSEVCVFCHSPHGTSSVVVGMVPLWNRLTSPNTIYTLYSAPNFEESGFDCGVPGCRPKGISLACLSCHDGTIAIDALVNAPGSGGYRAANRGSGSGPGSEVPLIGFTPTGIIGADGSLEEGDRDSTEQDTTAQSPFSGGIHDTITGNLALEGAEPFPNLTTYLADDHPLSMEIPYAGFNSFGGGTDPQFKKIGENSTLEGGVDGTSVKFITKVTGSLPSDKRDRIRAYPSTSTAGSYYVECASCHNPHTPRVSFLRLPSNQGTIEPADPIPSTWSEIDNTAGLRWADRPNSGSAICLSCHQK